MNQLNPVSTIGHGSIPGSVLDFLNRLPAYDVAPNTDELLDLMRVIQESEAYYWIGAAFPYGSNILIPASQTLSGTLALPAGTFILGMTHYVDTTNDQAGFKLNLYDKGTKASIFYGGYCLDRLIGSDMSLLYQTDNVPNPNTGGSTSLSQPFGPNYLISPFIVTPPGVINWEVVNLSTLDTNIQVMLCCAAPRTAKAMGFSHITGGNQ